MTRSDARELAVHLIYAHEFSGEDPQDLVAARLAKDYYAKLSGEVELYADRPTAAQRAYIDRVVAGVTNMSFPFFFWTNLFYAISLP